MKKIGFTLAEVLISLLIVGVVSALVAPTITKIMPNREKVLVIKAYRVLHETTTMMLEEPGFYLNGHSLGLDDISEPYLPNFKGTFYQGNNKYCNLLLKNMNNFSETLATNGASNWITEDFIAWSCKYDSSSKTATVIVDINEDSSPNCIYDATSCVIPDQYSFTVKTNGYIEGKDKLTQVYIKNKDRLNNRKADYAEL